MRKANIAVLVSGGGTNLQALMDVLAVTRTDLAMALSFAPSHISRILAGTRRPGSLPAFLDQTSTFLASRISKDSI